MKKNLLLVLFLLIQQLLLAQNADLLKALEKAEAAQDSRKIVALCQELLAIQAKDSSLIKTMRLQALHFSYLGELEKSEAAYTQLLETAQVVLKKDHPDYAYILMEYSYLKEQKGEKAAQISLLEEAYQQSRTKGSEAILVESANNMGLYYEMAGAMEFAIRYYKEALTAIPLAKKNDQDIHVSILHNLGRALEIQHRYDESESTYKEAFVMAKKIYEKNNPAYLNLLNDFGMLFFFKRQYNLAIPYFKEIAQLIENELIDIEYNTTTLCNLADCYAHLRQYEEAEKIYDEMCRIDLKNTGEGGYNYIVTISRLGDLYYLQGRYAEAEKMHLKALDLGRKHIAPQYIDRFYIQEQAYLFFENRGNWEAVRNIAIESFGLNCMDKKEDAQILVQIENLAEKQSFATMPYALKALVIAAGGYWEGYKSTGDIASLKDAFRILSAVKILLHRLKNSFSTELDKLDLLAMTQKISELGIHISQALYEKTGDAIYQKATFGFVENNKYVLLQDALQARAAQSFASLPAQLATEETNLEQNLLMSKTEKIQALEENAQQAATQKYNKALHDIDAFKSKIEKEHPSYFKFKYAKEDSDINAIKNQLKEGQALIEYFIGTKESHLFVITNNKINYLKIAISRDSIANQVERFRREISDYEHIKSQGKQAITTYSKLAHWFYAQLLQPALQKISEPINSLIIVPDGLLGHVPFEAFLMSRPKSGQYFKDLDYLINKYALSYLYAGSFLSNNKQVQRQNNHLIFGLAPEYKTTAKDLSTKITNRSEDLRSIRNSLQPLAAAQEEVNTLKSQFNGLFLFNKEANEKRFKQEAKDYAVLHLAMHGLLNEKFPILSSLAFTEDGDSVENNFLQAFEISKMNLNADLVVLSACETGYGKFQQGEGVMSLARSFMYAGVPSLVVSLWQVNDGSTSLIMQLFYKNLAKGMNKAEALQQAKLAYVQTIHESYPLAAHPAFWAAFIQIGNTEPISISQKGNFWLWVIGAGSVLLVLLVGARLVWGRKNREV